MSLVGPDQLLTLEPLSTEDAVQLLDKSIPGQDPCILKTLVLELSCIPLAIKQAAVLIKEEEISIEDYLKIFSQSQEDAIHLLSQDSYDHFRSNTPKAVIAAMKVTFDTIYEKAPWASRLLAFLAFIDGQCIPRLLLTKLHDHLQQPQHHTKSDNTYSQSSHSLADKLKILKNYYLISSSPEYTYSITNVVKLSMKAWLQWSSRYKISVDVCAQTLVASWPLAEEASDINYRTLILPHIAIVADCELLTTSPNTPWDSLLRQAGEFAFNDGRFLTACRLLEKSTLASKEIIDLKDPATLTSLLTYFRTLENLGRSREAQAVGEDLRGRMEMVLGQAHPATLMCRKCLGVLYLKNHHLEKVEEVLQDSYKDAKLVFEDDDQVFLDIRHILNMMYYKQGRYQEALALQLELYEIEKKKFGTGQPETFNSRSQIGRIYFSLSKWDKCKEWLEDLMRAVIEAYGKSHLRVAIIKLTLGKCYVKLNMLEDAERVSNEAMEIFTKEQGECHRNVLSCRQTIATVYRDNGQNEKFRDVMSQVVKLSERLEDGSWPLRFGFREDFAYALSLTGDLEYAIEITAQTLEMSKQRLGLNHVETASVLFNLSEFYADQEKFREAAPLAVQSYEIYLLILGKEHPTTLDGWYRARFLQMKNGTSVAAEELQSILEAHEAEYGEKDRKTLEVMYHLAWACWFQGRHDTAIRWMEHVSLIQRDSEGDLGNLRADKALKEMCSARDNEA